jgi:crossover junction endodeoxyribonuclease RuvC
LPQRLADIAEDIELLCKKWKPGLAVVEQVFFAKNAKTALAVAHARGAILLALARRSVKIQELTPLQLKMQITSYGKASKGQVQYMVQKLLSLPTVPKPDDAADALALALCGALPAEYAD